MCLSSGRMIRWFVFLGMTASIGLMGCRSRSDDGNRTVVRIGYQKTGTLNLVRMRGGLTADLAKLGVRVEWVGFPAGPQLLEALNAASVDFGHTGDTPPVLAQAAGVPFVYVAHEPSRPHAEAILVPAGSAMHSVAELKGKRVALNKGSNVHYLLVRALGKAGVRYDQVQTVFLPPSDARAAFSGGSVDAWAAWDPYFADAETGAGARVLADGEGLVSNREFHLASRELVRDRPDVVRAIVDAVNRDGRWAAANLDEVVRLFGAELGLEAETLRRTLTRKAFGVSLMDDGVIAEQQHLADAFAEIGLIPGKVVVRDAVASIGPAAAGKQGHPEL
jgi:sulfonate transport system substrate-binding protein